MADDSLITRLYLEWETARKEGKTPLTWTAWFDALAKETELLTEDQTD